MTFLHDLPLAAAERTPDAIALTYGDTSLSYGELAAAVAAFRNGLCHLELGRAERVAIYLDKRFETVIAAFGAAAAGGAFVPVNPLLKPEQVGYVLRDCNVRVLVTSAQRLMLLHGVLGECHDLRHVVLVGDDDALPATARGRALHRWNALCQSVAAPGHRVIDIDMAAILYTSGSTGRPKGVVLSHRNLVMGARTVVSYLNNTHEDVLLAVLPLSFDAGFSQLTTAFCAGARVVLLNYLLPRDLLNTLARERVTGLTAVPPLYIQLSELQWPEAAAAHLRYFANTGGRMPLEVLKRLRAKLPKAKPYLMYGLTEAFRATYLAPEEVVRRPDSIGKAVPNAEILVLREDGTRCAANEPGELVQRGALVAMGYWNAPEQTAEQFKPLPPDIRGGDPGIVLPETAVYSGDTVRQDEEGFLYFVGRRDEMIKTSGYRVSPTEIEEVVYGVDGVSEVAAFGVAHPALGQAIVVVAAVNAGANVEAERLAAACRQHLPLYMVPAHIELRTEKLPRNANGKIDRKRLASEYEGRGEW
ncbi:MAG TPA: acyl-CoA ligase (AMP-forming), exosortase A system-associated [Burkholderiales bacterium]|nr:acyl-CoA ligase (AMP-forming), exosortase A system-associated [Burkholderiales bacterium]